MRYTLGQIAHGAVGKTKVWLQNLGVPVDEASADLVAGRLVGGCYASCPHRIDPNGKPDSHSKCALCGCPVVDKARVLSEKCPDDPPRWPEPD
jgi:hypothetical protein